MIRKIKISLACSSDLKKERDAFEIFLYRKNKILIERNIFLELVIWEDFIDSISKSSLQDEYNKEVKKADIFVILFSSKMGCYSREEFGVAYETFLKTGKPRIYAYSDAESKVAETNDVDLQSLIDFRTYLKSIGHFPPSYSSIDGLLGQFYDQLEKLKILTPRIEKEFVTASVVEHNSEKRKKAFEKLFQDVDGHDNIMILGTGVTSFLNRKSDVLEYLKNKNNIEILLINNQIIKEDWNCTSDIFLRSVKESINGNSLKLTPSASKVHCPIANLNFQIDKAHFNNYFKRNDYLDIVEKSTEKIREYKKVVSGLNNYGKIEGRHFNSFVPMSITAILPDDSKNRKLVAEFLVPFTNYRILFESSDEQNPVINKLFIDFFRATWKRSKEII